jgi:hypothetical protein
MLCAALAGCYSPAYRDCEVSCSGGACPSGLACMAGVCRTEDATGSCGGSDARIADTPPSDAPYPTGMWGTPVPVPLMPVLSVADPVLTEDLLEMFVTVNNADLMVTTRASTDANAAWSPLILVENVTTASPR